MSGDLFVFSKELLCVFDKADENNNGRARESDKKQNFQHAHGKDCKVHRPIVTRFLMPDRGMWLREKESYKESGRVASEIDLASTPID